MQHRPIVEVRITNECLQKIANDSLQFFEVYMNEFDHKLQELQSKNMLTADNIQLLNNIGNVQLYCQEYDVDRNKIFLIDSIQEQLPKNSATATTTLFSLYDDQETETLEYF